MNNEGWMYADQIIKLSGIVDNQAGWVVDLYTENLVGHPTKYVGPLAGKGSVNGLVSSKRPIPDSVFLGLNDRYQVSDHA